MGCGLLIPSMFSVADSAIVVGAGLLVLEILSQKTQPQSASSHIEINQRYGN